MEIILWPDFKYLFAITRNYLSLILTDFSLFVTGTCNINLYIFPIEGNIILRSFDYSIILRLFFDLATA